MRTTVTLELDQALLQKAEAWAERHQITLSEAITNLLRELTDVERPPQKYSIPSLNVAFAELRQICQEENYSLEIPARSDRDNPFT